MKPYQLLSVGPAEPSPLRPHPVSFSRARVALSLLLAFCLSLAFLSPAFAADGALDPSFITGPGPYAGVQNIPEIRDRPVTLRLPAAALQWLLSHLRHNSTG